MHFLFIAFFPRFLLLAISQIVPLPVLIAIRSALFPPITPYCFTHYSKSKEVERAPPHPRPHHTLAKK